VASRSPAVPLFCACMLTGTSLYNEILKSFLPHVYPTDGPSDGEESVSSVDEDDLEAQALLAGDGAGGEGSGDLRRPLLGGGSGQRAVDGREGRKAAKAAAGARESKSRNVPQSRQEHVRARGLAGEGIGGGVSCVWRESRGHSL
jgi:hypothetical protein